MRKSPVPGLSRGLSLLRQFADGLPRTLDAATQASGYPKSSVRRILATLVTEGLMERVDGGQAFRAVARIVPAGGRPGFEERIQAVLERLAAETGQTAEWYTVAEKGLIITRRAAPPEAVVQLQAQIGFVRHWDDELDAVATIGLAFAADAPPVGEGLWCYDTRGERASVPVTDAREAVATARQARFAIETNYNNNGVKRMAAPVLDGAVLLGVLAVAMCFTPNAAAAQARRRAALARAAADLGRSDAAAPPDPTDDARMGASSATR
ncbi:MAG: helix-turn-helix domain-containing protein [Planctomycetota bacterium]